MKILLDHCTPRQVGGLLPGHEVNTTYRLGWADKDNGDLILAAETAAFDLFITTDRNIRYQQNLSSRKIGILLVPQDLDLLRAHADELLSVVNAMGRSEYRELLW